MCDQKLDVATVEAEPKSLTNIYYDCLERIFDFLDLESLMNVAGTCKRLQIAAAAKFADDYGHACVQLYKNRAHNNFIQYTVYSPMHSSIGVFGLKFCLTFLRCFGAKILNLYMHSMMATQNDDRYVGPYINQYCANTLTGMHFGRERSVPSEIFTNPFKAVKKLVLIGNLGDQFSNYVDIFPNLQQLNFIGRYSIDDNAIAVSFPHLEHLSIPIYGNRSDSITTESAIKFLRANQQLKSLDIFLNIKFDKLLDLINGNKSILKLNVSGIFTDLSADQVNRLANEHPLLEELNCPFLGGLEVDVAIALIRQLNSLKRFEFYAKGQTECDRFLSQLDSKWKHETEPYQYNTSISICLTRV